MTSTSMFGHSRHVRLATVPPGLRADLAAVSLHAVRSGGVPPKSSYRDFLLYHLQSDRFDGNKAKMAEAFGMTPKHLARGLEGETTFSLERNLVIADVLQEDPAHVLTLASWAESQRLLEKLYGRARLTPALEQLLEALKHCPTHFRHQLIEHAVIEAELTKRHRGGQ